LLPPILNKIQCLLFSHVTRLIYFKSDMTERKKTYKKPMKLSDRNFMLDNDFSFIYTKNSNVPIVYEGEINACPVQALPVFIGDLPQTSMADGVANGCVIVVLNWSGFDIPANHENVH